MVHRPVATATSGIIKLYQVYEPSGSGTASSSMKTITSEERARAPVRRDSNKAGLARHAAPARRAFRMRGYPGSALSTTTTSKLEWAELLERLQAAMQRVRPVARLGNSRAGRRGGRCDHQEVQSWPGSRRPRIVFPYTEQPVVDRGDFSGHSLRRVLPDARLACWHPSFPEMSVKHEMAQSGHDVMGIAGRTTCPCDRPRRGLR